jgi:hypothetical protein
LGVEEENADDALENIVLNKRDVIFELQVMAASTALMIAPVRSVDCPGCCWR